MSSSIKRWRLVESQKVEERRYTGTIQVDVWVPRTDDEMADRNAAQAKVDNAAVGISTLGHDAEAVANPVEETTSTKRQW